MTSVNTAVPAADNRWFNLSPAQNQSAVRPQIKAFADKAGNLARQIIADERGEDYSGPVVIRTHHHYHYGPSLWYPVYYQPSPVIVIPSHGRPQRREKEDNSFAWGVIGTILSLAAVYFVGSGIAKYQDASQEVEEVKDFKEKLILNQPGASPQTRGLIDQAYYTADITGRICKRIRNSALQDLALRIGILAGSVLLAAGGFAAAPALMVAGAITGVVTLGGMLFKWGLNASSRGNLRDAESLLQAVEVLKRN